MSKRKLIQKIGKKTEKDAQDASIKKETLEADGEDNTPEAENKPKAEKKLKPSEAKANIVAIAKSDNPEKGEALEAAIKDYKKALTRKFQEETEEQMMEAYRKKAADSLLLNTVTATVMAISFWMLFDAADFDKAKALIIIAPTILEAANGLKKTEAPTLLKVLDIIFLITCAIEAVLIGRFADELAAGTCTQNVLYAVKGLTIAGPVRAFTVLVGNFASAKIFRKKKLKDKSKSDNNK